MPAKRCLFLQLWQPNERWRALESEAQAQFLSDVAVAANAARDAGMEIAGWGKLESTVSNPATEQYCGVFLVEERDALAQIDQAIGAAGWYEYFEYTNVATELNGQDGFNAYQTLCELLSIEG